MKYNITPEDINVIPGFLGYWPAQCMNGKAWDHNNLKSLPNALQLFHGLLVEHTKFKVHNFMDWPCLVPLAQIIMQHGYAKEGKFKTHEGIHSHSILAYHFLTLSNEQTIWHCINYIKNEK